MIVFCLSILLVQLLFSAVMLTFACTTLQADVETAY